MNMRSNGVFCERSAHLAEAIAILDEDIAIAGTYAMRFQDDINEGLPLIAHSGEWHLEETLRSFDAMTGARDTIQEQLDNCIGCIGLASTCQLEQVED